MNAFRLRRQLGFAVTLLAGAFCVEAQDLEPRTYANAPVGLNFLVMGYGHTEGGVGVDSSLPLTDVNIEVHSTVAAYARTLDIAGKSAKFDVVLPYAWLSGTGKVSGDERDRVVDGFADPRVRFSVNLFGAPALTLDKFPSYQQDLIVGTVLEVTAPGGQYDADKLVNIGTNRWSIKPELGVSKRLGPVTLEMAGAVRFYTDNEEFFGGSVREQAVMYSLQGHLIYSFPFGIWAALDGTFYTGGETTINGEAKDDRLKNSRVGVTLALPVNRYNSVKLYASTGASGRTGSDFDTVGIAWQTRFGGGL
ncbi:MAG: transporter [Methylobacter sp.]|nr:transporter [Methylobacter sp.]